MFVRRAAITAIAVLATGVATAGEPVSVYVETMQLDNLEITQPDRSLAARGKGFELNDQELASLQEMYANAMLNAVERDNDFVLATDAESSDIVINAELVRLVPTAPKDDFKSRGVRETIVSRGPGSAKIHFVVSRDDEVIVDVQDYRDAGMNWQENNRFNNRRDTKRLFSRWANFVLAEIEATAS